MGTIDGLTGWGGGDCNDVNDPGWRDRQYNSSQWASVLGGLPIGVSIIAQLGVDKTHDERTITIFHQPRPDSWSTAGKLINAWVRYHKFKLPDMAMLQCCIPGVLYGSLYWSVYRRNPC